MKTEVREIKISEIVGSLCRMRLEKDYEKEELMASIKRRGVMNPIKIKKTKKGYLLFAGHRRKSRHPFFVFLTLIGFITPRRLIEAISSSFS